VRFQTRAARRLVWLGACAAGVLASTAAAIKTTGEQKLVPSTVSNDEVGWAVDMDNGVAVVGAPQDSDLSSSSGAVYVYTQMGGSLVQTAKLTASDGVAGDELGTSTSIDGDTVAAGAYHRWTPTSEAGRAYVFHWNGASWDEEGKVTAPDGVPNDAFGWAVALSGDWLAVGAPHAWVGSPSGGGAVYIFERVEGVWYYSQKLIRGDHAFGWSLAMDGTTLAVGSSLYPNERVSIYDRDGDGFWSLQATIDPADSVFNDFGNSVGLDGDDLVVGAWFESTGGSFGAAYFFHRTGSSWSQVQKIYSPGGARAETFGEAVALQGDLAIITDSGLDFDDEFEDTGAAYLYRRKGSKWAAAGKLVPSDYETYTPYFGTAAAIDGARLLIGAAYAWDEPSESYPGAAYLYEIASGSKLVIKNALPDNESKNRIIFKGKGLLADAPFPGSADDPTCGGGASASLTVASGTSGETFTALLPCANWSQTASGYRYRDPELDDSPCRLVTFEPGRPIKAVCSGAGTSALGFDLEPGLAQLPIGVTLTLGTSSYCTSFGGKIKADGTDGRAFKAVNAGAPQPCG